MKSRAGLQNPAKTITMILHEGLITRSTGSWYQVRLDDGKTLSARIKGKFRLEDKRITNPIAVGDRVRLGIERDGTGIIQELLPRRNYVLRRSTHKKHFLHLIASNLDQVFLIVTLRYPNLKPGFIDRFILTTESHDIPTYIIVNKADLYDEDDLEDFSGLKYIYEKIGYKVLLVSAETGEGVEQLREILRDKITLLSGHSGVGKSSLVNAIEPGLDLRTSEISDYSEKGQHTTTFAEMHALNGGGSLIDTPGIKEFGFINLTPEDVAHNFKEIFETSQQCKYGNCRHQNEPICAVKKAVEEGQISPLRYQSYLSILEEVQEQNHWERKTDW